MVTPPLSPSKIIYTSDKPNTYRLQKCILSQLAPGEQRIEYIFDQETVSIGGDDSNDIVLEDEIASRRHCQITLHENGYSILDLGSTNGTYVNDVRIREAYLDSGSVIRIGHSQYRFESLDEQVEIAPLEKNQLGRIVGSSVPMRQIFALLEKVAPTEVTVVIEGETGTGKEVVARTIHESSQRKDQPFVVFDCSAVPENLIESELFGHERGSFTGATAGRMGLFEVAHGGTLFLDELGELSLDLQPKLLRALEQREIRRVGSNKPIHIDVRIIAATNRKLGDEVKAGRFREDLYYRLSVVSITLPPLRERKSDIPILAKHILERAPFNKDPDGMPRVIGISRQALDNMMLYEWPGNVRELVNVVERACAYSDGQYIGLKELPIHIAGVKEPRPRKSTAATTIKTRVGDIVEDTFKDAKAKWLSTFETHYIRELLERNSFNISQAAKEADLDRKYFRKLMRKHDIDGGLDND